MTDRESNTETERQWKTEEDGQKQTDKWGRGGGQAGRPVNTQ